MDYGVLWIIHLLVSIVQRSTVTCDMRAPFFFHPSVFLERLYSSAPTDLSVLNSPET